MWPYSECEFLKFMKIFKYCCLPFTMYRAVDFFLFINAKTLIENMRVKEMGKYQIFFL